jgi:hypothetical protein
MCARQSFESIGERVPVFSRAIDLVAPIFLNSFVGSPGAAMSTR